MKPIKLSYLQTEILPLLALKHKTKAALQKGIQAFLKQGEEEEIPVVNEDGEPVEISEIILVGAEPADEEPMEEEPAAEEITQASINAMVTKAIGEATKAHTPKRPHSPTKAERIPAQAKRHTGKLKCFTGDDAEYKAFGFGQFIISRAHQDSGMRQKAYDWLAKEGHTKAMNEGSNIAGGAFVPEEFSADLIRLVEEFGVFRSKARVVPMSRDTLLFPRRTSGLTGIWPSESGTITDSDAGTDNVQLTARKLATLTRISNELMDDSIIGMGDFIGTEIAQTMANEEDEAGFNGDGTNTFGGQFGATVKIIDGNHTAGVIDAPTGDTDLSFVVIESLHECVGTLPRYAMGNAKWYCHNSVFANVLQRLGAAQGGVTWAETAAGPEMRFLGFPVVLSQVMFSSTATSASSVILLFGDLSLSSTFGDRKSVEIATSTERYFEQDQTAIRGIERVHIVNHDLGDTTDAGPIVALRLAAS